MFITDAYLFVADETFYADDDLNKWKVASGLETVMPNTAGVYHYKTTSHAYHINTCSLVVQGGARNHTIHVTDTGFEPKVLTAHAGDRIWWVWQDGEKEHNILQVCEIEMLRQSPPTQPRNHFRSSAELFAVSLQRCEHRV